MSTDAETLAVYDQRAAQYAETFGSATPGGLLRRFMAMLPEGGAVLDLGCGPGQSAAFLAEAGFHVTAMDPSRGMVEAARKIGIEVQQAGFEDLDAHAAYDGIWCNFALLHAARDDVPAHLTRMQAALRPGGFLHLAVKSGTGTSRDAIGRRYTYFEMDELQSLLGDAGFEILATETGEEVGMAGTCDPWIALRARVDGNA